MVCLQVINPYNNSWFQKIRTTACKEYENDITGLVDGSAKQGELRKSDGTIIPISHYKELLHHYDAPPPTLNKETIYYKSRAALLIAIGAVAFSILLYNNLYVYAIISSSILFTGFYYCYRGQQEHNKYKTKVETKEKVQNFETGCQAVLQAQEYFLEGPRIRREHLEDGWEKFRKLYEARLGNESKERNEIRLKQNKVLTEALEFVFQQKKKENIVATAQLVAKMFQGLSSDPMVVEYYNAVIEKEKELEKEENCGLGSDLVKSSIVEYDKYSQERGR